MTPKIYATNRIFLTLCRNQFAAAGDNSWANTCTKALAGNQSALYDCSLYLLDAINKCLKAQEDNS